MHVFNICLMHFPGCSVLNFEKKNEKNIKVENITKFLIYN